MIFADLKARGKSSILWLSFGIVLFSLFTFLGSKAFAVNENTTEFSALELKRILTLSPLPPPPADLGNHYTKDTDAIRFGRKLFFDPKLSADGKTSCATCHIPELGWSNGKPVSSKAVKFPRNVPSIWNTAYKRWFFWDGRADSAWAQALAPLENPHEMGSNRVQLVAYLFYNPELKTAYENIFGDLPHVNNQHKFPKAARPDQEDTQHPLNLAWQAMSETDRQDINTVFSNIGKAIAAFEYTLVTPESKFDRFVAALRLNSDQQKLSPPEQRGLKLFVGKGKCTFCHSGPNFTDGEFHDLGLAVGKNMNVDPGRYGGIKTVLNDPFNRMGAFVDETDQRAPIHYLSLQGNQLAQFKTPSLRQLIHTAPYMHDGRFATLAEVIEFYSSRTNAKPLEHASNLVQALNLSATEKHDLLAFLKTLSSTDDKISYQP